MSKNKAGKDDKSNFIEAVKESLKDLRILYVGFTRLELIGNNRNQKIKKLHSSIQNLSFNQIENIEFLAKLPNLINLNLQQNSISNLNSFKKEPEENEENLRWQELKYLNLSENKINEINILRLPKIIELNLQANEIRKIESVEGLENIEILNISHNQIQDISKIENLSKLREIYLGNNRIKSFPLLNGLDSIKKLHLRNNYIFNIEEEALKENETLEYLNLRENKLEKFEELIQLQCFTQLKVLIFTSNPVIQKQENYFNETLSKLKHLKRMNKQELNLQIRKDLFEYEKEKFLQEKQKLEQEEKEKEEEEQLNQISYFYL